MSAIVGFGIVTGLGFVILLISLVFDGVIDIFDADLGSGWFSTASIGGLVTGIGLGGIIGTSLEWSLFNSFMLGLGTGLLVAFIAVSIYKLLKQAEVPQEAQSLDTIIGQEAVVTIGAEAGGKGMVQVLYLGAPKTLTFISDYPLSSGDSAIVTNLLSQDTARIIPNPAA